MSAKDKAIDLLVVAALLLVGLAACAALVFEPGWLASRRDAAESVGALATAAAVIFGGGFAFVRFRIRREARQKLGLEISGHARPLPLTTAERTRWELRVSLAAITPEAGTGVRLLPEGTALEAYVADFASGESRASWVHLESWPVFEGHEAIEPGESVADEVLLRLELAERTEVRLLVRVLSEEGNVWKRTKVVPLLTNGDNGGQ